MQIDRRLLHDVEYRYDQRHAANITPVHSGQKLRVTCGVTTLPLSATACKYRGLLRHMVGPGGVNEHYHRKV